jgi:hypothetical protein
MGLTNALRNKSHPITVYLMTRYGRRQALSTRWHAQLDVLAAVGPVLGTDLAGRLGDTFQLCAVVDLADAPPYLVLLEASTQASRLVSSPGQVLSRHQVLATSLYEDPSAGLHEDASASVREHLTRVGCSILCRPRCRPVRICHVPVRIGGEQAGHRCVAGDWLWCERMVPAITRRIARGVVPGRVCAPHPGTRRAVRSGFRDHECLSCADRSAAGRASN